MSEQVLLTGATGFIGRHCLPFLVAEGFEVHATYWKSLPSEFRNTTWHQLDLFDENQIARLLEDLRPKYLLHLAWITAPGEFWNSSLNLKWLSASLALVQAFARNGGERVVGAGSMAEYAWENKKCSVEQTPLAPKSLYGVCKHALQMIMHSYATLEGFEAAWGRVFNLYGPNEHPGRLVAYVIQSLLKNKVASCSNGEQIRDYLFVEDAARGFVTLLQSNIIGPVNIASAQPISIKELVERIAKKLEKEESIHFGDIPLSDSEPAYLVADQGRMESEADWSPQIDLDEGIEKSIFWWTNQLSMEESKNPEHERRSQVDFD